LANSTGTPRIGTSAACAAAGVPQAAWYRRHRVTLAPPKPAPVPRAERIQPRGAAPPAERAAILEALPSERFAVWGRESTSARAR
jgi:putative transposase